MTDGFRWCPHCKGPHRLSDRFCRTTGQPFDTRVHTAKHAKPSLSPLVGTVLGGRYRVLRLIGGGGMGQVYEAENLVLQRVVAIKVVAPGGNPEALLRLEREAQLVAALKHPNICDVYDVGRADDGKPYVVFERLFGETLAAHIKRVGRLPIPATIDIFSQMLSGLQVAHDVRIVHRDLKPQNVFLVDRAGFSPLVKIVDFGFARDLSSVGADRLTKPGNMCGTVQYMSPEQLRNDSMGHQSDLFAVGIMLYEALTARHPFAATSPVELQTNIMRASPVSIRSRRNGVPRALDDLVLRTLSAAPHDRPASALELQAALLSLSADRPPSGIDEVPPPSSSMTDPVWIPPASNPVA